MDSDAHHPEGAGEGTVTAGSSDVTAAAVIALTTGLPGAGTATAATVPRRMGWLKDGAEEDALSAKAMQIARRTAGTKVNQRRCVGR